MTMAITNRAGLRLANLIDSLVTTTPQYRNELTPRDKAAEYIHRAENSDHADANDRLWQLDAVRQSGFDWGSDDGGSGARSQPAVSW